MENDDIWGEELPDETIDELFRASQSCTQLSDNQKPSNAIITSASSDCFTSFRIPNIKAAPAALTKNLVSLPPQKKSAFVPRKISKMCLGMTTVAEDSKAFDNAFQLSKEFHISSDSLKLSQEVHRQNEPILQPSCSKKENNCKKVQNNSKSCVYLGPNNSSVLIDNNKQHEAEKMIKPSTVTVINSRPKLHGAKCNLVKQNNNVSHNKTLLNASSLHAELINLQQKSEKVKRNRHELVVKPIPVENDETPHTSVAREICEKERSQLLPSKLNKMKIAERKLADSKCKINIDLSKHTHQTISKKFTFSLNLLKATFHRGILFGDLLGPCIFEKSLPESPLIELRNVQSFSERKKKKQVHFEKLLADYNRLNNVSLYQNRRSTEHCYTSLHRLILLESLDSTGAKLHVEKIVCEVTALLGDQLTLLRELKLSSTELQELDRELAEMPNRGEALAISLTSPQFWHNKEAGVEARRGLGALVALVSLSQHAVNLVTGASEPSPAVQATSVQKNDSSPYVYKERQSDARDTHVPYRNMKFGFLTLVRDLCTAIRQERRALAYTGVLAGVVSLLTAARIACSALLGESRQLLCEIVKEVVFCRPRVEVVVPLVHLLSVANPDVQVSGSLCRNSPKDKYVEKCGVVFFHSEDSCVLQVLCCLLEYQRVPEGVLAVLCHQVVRWLSGSFLAPGRGPHWLQPVAEDSRPACACRRRVAEVTCNLLHRTFLNFVELDRKRADDSFPLAAGGHHEESPVLCKLRDTLREGIALLHRLEDRNPDFMINVASSEGEWQSFVLGCSRNRSVLRLTAEQQRCLEELVASVEVDVVADSNLPSQADLDVIFEHLWKDNLRYIRRNYVPPRNSNF